MALLAQIGSKGCWLLRWKAILDSSGHSPGMFALARLLLLGMFFNNFLPSSVGGDLARGVGLASSGVPRAKAAASVLADRVVGLFALAVTGALGGLAGAWFWPERGPWGTAAVVSGTAAAAVAATFHRRTIAKLRRLPWLASEGGLARKARRLLEAAGFLAERQNSLRRALVLSLGLSAFATIYHWGIGRALDIPVPFAAYCVIVPAVMSFSSLPITLNGLGIREVGFVGLLAAQGVPRAEATVFALLAFVGTLGFSIAGGVLFVGGSMGKLAGTPGEMR